MQRNYNLDLTEEDFRMFEDLARRLGMNPEEILQGFICDLVDGSQSNGSDERLLAQEYLDRCGYDMF